MFWKRVHAIVKASAYRPCLDLIKAILKSAEEFNGDGVNVCRNDEDIVSLIRSAVLSGSNASEM